MGRGHQRALAGAASAGGLSGPGSWTQSVPLLHIGSSEEVVCPTVGVAVENKGFLQDTSCRGGERVREEAVEREREEAVQREQEAVVQREREEAVQREREEAVQREREEAVQREREEAVERLLQWRLGWLLERQLGW